MWTSTILVRGRGIDMIDEKKLIEDIEKDRTAFRSELYTDDSIRKYFVGAVEEQPQADKWIPCSSGVMPKDNQEVLIFTDGNIEIDTYYDGEFEACCFYGNEVIAWMPLPQAYKGE